MGPGSGPKKLPRPSVRVILGGLPSPKICQTVENEGPSSEKGPWILTAPPGPLQQGGLGKNQEFAL